MDIMAVKAGYQTASYRAKTKVQEMDFSLFAPNVPEKVKEAFSQAAEKTGYRVGGKMEYPLAGDIDKSDKALQYQEQEKEGGKTQEDAQGSVDYREFLRKKTEELYVRFKKGEFDPTYQIGAASFTEKEWDKLLEKFDAIQEEIRVQMREEHEKREQKAEEDLRQNALLNSDYTTAAYPQQNNQEEEVHYITCYTEEGIFCRREGVDSGYEWSIRFNSKEEYSKVMQFINQFPSDWNLRFTSHENFFRDFLDNKIDVDAFTQFMQETKNGVPDYTVTKGDSTYIDTEKAKWAKYMNQDIGSFYTAEEMMRMQEEEMEKNREGLYGLFDYENIYRLSHPEYRGERIFCEYPGGPLYTASEISKRMYQNYLEQKETV